MGSPTDRTARHGSLTRRLTIALSLGALFVATTLGLLGADHTCRQLETAAAAADASAASDFAERAAPLLERDDVLRLSVLAAAVAGSAGDRVVVLEKDGRVVIDTQLVLGGRQLPLLTERGPRQRTEPADDGPPSRHTAAPITRAQTRLGEVRLTRAIRPSPLAFDWSWFGLSLLCCLTLVAAAAMIGHHWSLRVRSATDALMRIASGEVAAAPTTEAEGELRDLNLAMRELERGMNDGLERVGAAYVAMALSVVDGLEQRRLAPPGHGQRTASLAARLADKLQLVPAEREDLETACRLVDLGKASVRASILHKQGPLSDAEARSLEHHPVHAAERLECVPSLRRVAKLLRHQLERYDGRGTPDGLRGDRLPLGARVLAIAAAFDLLTRTGVERPLEWHEALEQLERAKGEVFDPWLVDLFCEEIRLQPPEHDREVAIVPAGAMPWRMVESDLDAEEGVDVEGAGDLEVLLDDFPFEEPQS